MADQHHQNPDIKPRSRDVTDGLEKAAARGMLRAVGMGDDDWVKPQIGVASSWNEITPCNLSLDRLAKAVKNGVHAAGGYPHKEWEFLRREAPVWWTDRNVTHPYWAITRHEDIVFLSKHPDRIPPTANRTCSPIARRPTPITRAEFFLQIAKWIRS